MLDVLDGPWKGRSSVDHRLHWLWDLIDGKLALIASNSKHEVGGAGKGQAGDLHTWEYLQALQGVGCSVVPEDGTGGGADGEVGGEGCDGSDQLLPAEAGQRWDSSHQLLHWSPFSVANHNSGQFWWV